MFNAYSLLWKIFSVLNQFCLRRTLLYIALLEVSQSKMNYFWIILMQLLLWSNKNIIFPYWRYLSELLQHSAGCFWMSFSVEFRDKIIHKKYNLLIMPSWKISLSFTTSSYAREIYTVLTLVFYRTFNINLIELQFIAFIVLCQVFLQWDNNYCYSASLKKRARFNNFFWILQKPSSLHQCISYFYRNECKYCTIPK